MKEATKLNAETGDPPSQDPIPFENIRDLDYFENNIDNLSWLAGNGLSYYLAIGLHPE